MSILVILAVLGREKQSQSAGLWPEIRNTKTEIRNELNGCQMTDSSVFVRRRLEKTKPIYFVLRTAWCVLRYGFVIPVKTGIQSLLCSYGFRTKCGITGLKANSKGYYLKKQSQFSGGQIYAISVIAMVYGVFSGFGLEKNKANSKHALSAVEWANFTIFCLCYRGFITITDRSVSVSMSQAGLTVMSQSRGLSLLLSHWATVPTITGVLRNPGFFWA